MKPRLGSPALRRVMKPAMPPDMAACVPDEASGARVAGGRAAVERGNAFETWLSDQHKLMRLVRRAYIRKVGAPVYVGHDGEPKGFAGKGPADFQGVIVAKPHGLPVAIEAKSREGRLTARDIPEHQREDLEAVEAFGGLSLVVIELRDEEHPLGARYVLTRAELVERWTHRQRTVKRGGVPRIERSESVGHEELNGFEVPRQGLYLARWL